MISIAFTFVISSIFESILRWLMDARTKTIRDILAICLLSSPIAVHAEERTFFSSNRLLLGTETNRSACVRIGDIDGDKDLDVVIANGRHWPQQNYIFFNQGRARFNLARPLGQNLSTSYATELADLDNDGDIDIAVGNDNAPNAVFLNDGRGHFQNHGTFGQPSSIRSLTLADIDQDGDVDILACVRGSQNIIYLNDGFANFPSSRPFGDAADSTIDVAVGDFNNDGHLDLVLANRDAQQNVVILNNGQARFNQRIPFGTGRDETRAVAIADLDGDGNLDWVTGNIGQPNSIYLGDGRGGVCETVNFGRADGRTYTLALVCDDPSNPFLVVLRLSDGEELWRVSREGISERSWATPLIHEGPVTTQVVVNGWPWVVSYDLQSGDELWRIQGGGDNPIPTPFISNGWIYITSAHGRLSPIYVVRSEARGDITPSKDAPSNEGIVWSTFKGGSYMSTPVVYGGHIYLGTRGIVRCFDATTGKENYAERLDGRASIIASLVAADGKIYCTSEEGTVYVLAAGPDFKVLARNPMGEPCFATPAISQGVIYFRTTESLIAIK